MGIEQLSTIWPEWSAVEQIGEGSFGKVYKVVRESHGITDFAAVKVITIPQNPAELNSLRADGYDETSARSYFNSIVTDFVNEIKLMDTMKGTANIVSVEDYKVIERSGEIGWDIYIRMELLTSFLDYTTDKKLSQDEVIKLGQDICSALELCAQRKIIHRDIKPENIFVSSFGDFKLGDFGIARELEKTSGSMSAKGTYNYIAPEIAKAQKYDATVDTYSLGLVLYKLLNNNRLPFINPYAEHILYQDRKAAVDRRLSCELLPHPVDASLEIGHAIVKACHYDPSLRFKTATEFKQALEAVKNGTYEIVPFGAQNLIGTFRHIDVDKAAKKGSKLNKNVIIITGIACAFVIALIAITLPFLNRGDIGIEPQPPLAPEQSPLPTPVPTPSEPAQTDMPEDVDSSSGENNQSGSKDLPDAEDSFDIVVSHSTIGNTLGNIVNHGLVAMEGEWIYFSNVNDGGKIYAMRTDGSELHKINDAASSFINVVDGWIYYRNEDDGHRIYAMQTDGSNQLRLNYDRSGSISVTDGLIFFSNQDDNSSIYVMEKDGSNQRKLGDDPSWSLNVVNGWIYYANISDDFSIYTISVEGYGRRKLNNDSSVTLHVVGDWIYYAHRNGGVFRMRTDGTEQQRLNDARAFSINVIYDWIIFTVRTGGDDFQSNIYAMRTDGSDLELLEESVGHFFINIVDGWIFYYHGDHESGILIPHDNLTPYIMRTDGSNRQPLEEWTSR